MENKSQRTGYPSVNQHSPSKCNFKDGKGGMSHVCSLEVIEYIWCFICSIYSNWNIYGFFETAHLDYHEGNIEGSILCSKNPGNMPKLNTSPNEVCLVTNIPELLRWPMSEWMTAISAWPSMAGKMSKIHQGYMGALSVEWCNMRPSKTRWFPGALTTNWGFDLQQERSFENGRMVHQCHRLVVDLFVMKARWFGTFFDAKLPWNGSAFRNQVFTAIHTFLPQKRKDPECSNKKG